MTAVVWTLRTLLFVALSVGELYGQILCIDCFRQNAPVSANITNLVTNGSFENSTCAGTNGYFCYASANYMCDIANWNCSGGGPLTYAHLVDSNGWFVADGIQSIYMGNMFCGMCSPMVFDNSCINRQGCIVTGIPAGYPVSDIDYGGQNGVSIWTVVHGLTAGQVYVLEFWAGGEGDSALWSMDGIFAVDIGFGNTFLTCPRTITQTGIGQRYIIRFTASSSSHLIKFTNWGHSCYDCTEVILDDVRVYPVSELSSIVPACVLGKNEMDLARTVTVMQNNHSRNLVITSSSERKLRMIIHNSLSEKVSEMEFTGSAVVDLSDLVNGVYVYEITFGSQSIRKDKFIIAE